MAPRRRLCSILPPSVLRVAAVLLAIAPALLMFTHNTTSSTSGGATLGIGQTPPTAVVIPEAGDAVREDQAAHHRAVSTFGTIEATWASIEASARVADPAVSMSAASSFSPFDAEKGVGTRSRSSAGPPHAHGKSWPWFADAVGACLAGAGARRVLTVGDSHARQMLETLIDRADPSKRASDPALEKSHKSFALALNVGGGAGVIVFEQIFSVRPNGAELRESGVVRRVRGTHVVVSRGAWDLLMLGTSLATFYSDVYSLLDEALAQGAASVTLRLPHWFRELQHRSMQQCVAPHVVDAYRRLGACAVERLLAQAPMGSPLYLLDPSEAAASMRMKKDGVHIVDSQAGFLVDAVLATAVCHAAGGRGAPPQKWQGPSISMLRNASVIGRLYRCGDFEHLLPKAGSGVGSPPSRQLERFFGVGPRHRCRCDAEVGSTGVTSSSAASVNDQCLFDHRGLSRSRDELPLALHRGVCALRRGVAEGSIIVGRETNLTAMLLNDTDLRAQVWLGTLVTATCVDPRAALAMLLDAGVRLVVPQPTIASDEGACARRNSHHLLPRALSKLLPVCSAVAAVGDTALLDTASSIGRFKGIATMVGTNVTTTLLNTLAAIGRCADRDGDASSNGADDAAASPSHGRNHTVQSRNVGLEVALTAVCHDQWKGVPLRQRLRKAHQSGDPSAAELAAERVGLLRWLRARRRDWTAAHRSVAEDAERTLQRDR